MAYVEVLREDDLWVGEMRRVEVGGQPVLLLRVETGVFAYVDRCAHLGMALSDGTLEDCRVKCPAHHYEYDARTGMGVNPRGVRLEPVPILCRGGAILVDAGAGTDR